jgi:hypothetical protein
VAVKEAVNRSSQAIQNPLLLVTEPRIRDNIFALYVCYKIFLFYADSWTGEGEVVIPSYFVPTGMKHNTKDLELLYSVHILTAE